MKHHIFFLLFTGMAAICVAQEPLPEPRFSLRAGGGYNFPFATGLITTTTQSGAYPVSGIYGSWAEGWLVNMDFGIRAYKSFWGVLFLNYTSGKSAEMYAAYPSIGHTSSIPSNKFRIPITIMLGGRYFIRLSGSGADVDFHKLKNRFQPYLGIGAGIALAANMKTGTSRLDFDINPHATGTMDVQSTTTFRPGAVLYGEAGVNFAISKSFSVFLEARFTSLSLMNYKRKVTSAILDGWDATPHLSTQMRETDYVKEVPVRTTGSDYPDQALADKYPASGIAVNCGLSWNFGFGGKVMLSPKQPLPPGANNPGAGGGATTAKIKNAAGDLACKDCPPIELTLNSNNDGGSFPGGNISRGKLSGPWGSSGVDSVVFDEKGKEIVCQQCSGSGFNCCCRLAKLNVMIYFHISLDTAAINKGVWLNTNKESGKFGRTITVKELPKDQKDKEDYKKVDKESVEVHERQHCSDLKDAIRKVIEDELSKFPVLLHPCSEDAKVDCKKQINARIESMYARVKKAVSKAVEEITAAEKQEYGKLDFEKHAREIQAGELNGRH